MFKFVELTGGSVDPNTWGQPCTPRADMIFNIQSMVDLHPNPRDPENPVQVPVRVVWCYEGMFKVQETLEEIQKKIKEALEDQSSNVFIKPKSTSQQHEQFLKSAGVNTAAIPSKAAQEQRAISYQPEIPAPTAVKKGVLAGLLKGNGENYD